MCSIFEYFYQNGDVFHEFRDRLLSNLFISNGYFDSILFTEGCGLSRIQQIVM